MTAETHAYSLVDASYLAGADTFGASEAADKAFGCTEAWAERSKVVAIAAFATVASASLASAIPPFTLECLESEAEPSLGTSSPLGP